MRMSSKNLLLVVSVAGLSWVADSAAAMAFPVPSDDELMFRRYRGDDEVSDHDRGNGRGRGRGRGGDHSDDSSSGSGHGGGHSSGQSSGGASGGNSGRGKDDDGDRFGN